MCGTSLRRGCLLFAIATAAGCSAFGSIFRSERPAPVLGALGDELARTLPSGIRVVVLEAPTASVVALELVVATGSADDPPDAPGVARALDHVLLSGSALERVVAARGGTVEAWTTRESTHVAVVVPAAAFDETLTALGRMALSPRWSPAGLDRAIGAMVAEVRRSRAAPDRLALEEVFATMRAGTPWAAAPIGTVEALGRLRGDALRRFHAARWIPPHMTLAIAGSIEAPAAIDATRRAFGGTPHRPAPRPRAPTAPPEADDLRLRVRGDVVTDASIALGFAVDDASPTELAALQLATMLSPARVGAALERTGLAVGPNAGAGAALDVLSGPTTLLVWARADGSRAPAAVEVMLAELFRLGGAAAGDGEVRRARAGLTAADARARDSMAGLAATLAERETNPRGVGAREEARSERVGARAVRDAAARLLVPERTVVAVVLPEERAAAAERALAGAAARAREEAVRHLAAGERTTLPGGVAREVLANGARLLLALDRRAPLVAVRLAVLGGARVENESAAGASSLLAAMMRRSAAREAPPEAQVAAFAGRDSFGLEGSFRAVDVEAGLEALARGLFAPDLEPAAIEEERRALALARRAAEGDARARALRAAAGLLYGAHPYAGDPTGTPEGLAALDRGRLAAFHAQTVLADRLVAVVVGDATEPAVFGKLRELFGGMTRGGSASAPPAPEVPAAAVPPERIAVAGPHAEVVVALPGAAWAAADRPALEVAVALLDGPDGRLARSLDLHGLALASFARSAPGALAGHVELGATVAPENEAAAREVILAAVAALRTQTVPTAELERARGAAAGRAALAIDGLGPRAAALAFAELAGAAGLVADLPARLLGVTAEDVRDAVQRAWAPGRERVVVAGP